MSSLRSAEEPGSGTSELADNSPKRSLPALLWVVVGFSALTGLLMGFDLSVIAVVLNPIQQQFHLCQGKEYTCFKRELFVSMIAPGALVGSLGGGWSADKFGRRYTLVISDVFFILGSLIFYFANQIAHLLIARAAIGVGVGIGFVVFSTYVAEIAPSDMRGRLIVCQEIAQACGVLLTYLAASIVGDKYWREFLVSGAIVAFVQVLGISILPESPRWLLMQNQPAAAKRIMKRLGMDTSEIMEEEEQELSRQGTGVSQRVVFQNIWNNKRQMLTACFVGIAQNVLCTSAALYYSTDLFLFAGVCKPYQWGMGLGAMKLAGTLVVFGLVDTLGRRKLLMAGTGGLFFVYMLLAFAYSLVPHGEIEDAAAACRTAEMANNNPTGLSGTHSIIVLIGMFGLVLSWEISWAALMYVVASEIIPSSIRGVGMGIVIFCFWISLFLSQLLFEYMFRIITISGTFVGLAVASIVILALTFLYVPDMTGKSLEAIVRMLSNPSSLLDVESDQDFPSALTSARIPRLVSTSTPEVTRRDRGGDDS